MTTHTTDGWRDGDIARAVFIFEYGETASVLTQLQGGVWRSVNGHQVPAHLEENIASLTPLATIAFEDVAEVEEFTRTFYAVRGLGEPALAPDRVHNMQEALRRHARTRDEVFEHYLSAQPDGSSPARSVCGKVWWPSARSVAKNRCPDCIDIVESGWSK